jgi:two-component system chemotaxis response regulator CheB
MPTINVMVIDDSAVVRQVLSQVLNGSKGISVYAVANDPIFAYEKMKKQWPDVIILDIEMPRMDGITFLKKIMSERPTPIIICSSLAEKGTELSLTALSLGAFDIITKPTLGVKNFLEDLNKLIINTVRAAAKANIKAVTSSQPEKRTQEVKTKRFDLPLGEVDIASMAQTTDRVIGIGSSTGGTVAIEKVLLELPRTCPGIVIVQHMPEKFTKAFADRLNTLCELDIAEASSGDRVLPGKVFIAPGGKHLQVKRSGGQYITIVSEGPAVNRHCPSVDVLFKSLAENVGHNALGVILTGMGKDGAQGLLSMKDVGSNTVAQNEQSCVVFGMPNEAIKLGAANHIVDINEVAKLITG